MVQLWEVVGGADKGGIIVRDFSNAKLEERLSTGALVQETELQGDRLSYKLLEGSGPTEGTVTIKLPGKDLVIKTDKQPGGGAAAPPATAPPATNGSAHTNGSAPADASVPTPAAAPEEPAAAAKPAAAVGEETPLQARIRARCERELARPPLQWQWIDQNLVTNNHTRKAPGMAYGLEFPWNEATLEEMGPAWLTRAMHTVGSLPSDNRVTKIILEKKIKVTTGNNGGKFLFEVEYEKEDPDLHTKLFAKVPFALEGKTAGDRMSSSVNKQPAELYEINAYRLLEAMLPMKTPRFYFGDISNETSNWIIITERIAFHDFDGNNFGKPSKETLPPLPAYQIEGPYDKCIDYNLRGKPEEYYMLLTKVGAKMAGMAKCGKLGSQELILSSFRASPSSEDWGAWGMNPEGPTGENPKQVKAKLDNAMKFITETGKAIFQKFTARESFKKKFMNVMMTVNAYNSEMNFWMHQNPNYVSLGHMNLNVDNAYFWRNEAGALECGVFDWGGLGSSSYGTKLWWWYYCMDYEAFRKLLPKLLPCFCEEYQANGGPPIDAKELEPMVIIAAIQQMSGLVSAVPQIIRMCPKKEWDTIKDRYDPRIGANVDGKSTLRLYLHCMDSIMRIIEEMKGDKIVETWIKDVYVGKWGCTPKSNAIIGLE